MSSSNALTSGGGSGVGWQVDISGLSSLILSLGAAGLKQFATAGVDIHTVGCMLKLAEICPASNEYRREIGSCRQEQRKQSMWFYKVVEFGTATNFVADELIKTRAGENVVALLSTFLPFMNDSSCDDLLLKLFEANGASFDHTPGLGQLRSFRATLLPLAQKTYFKDKTFQYHMWMKTLLPNNGSSGSMPLNHPYNSIPDEKTAVFIIQSFSKLLQRNSQIVMIYHGLKGAAWLATYARDVLDLPVCVMRTTADPIPIRGEYDTAKVLLYIFETDNKCELVIRGKVEDFFVPESLAPADHDRWTIDVEKTNVMQTYLSVPDELATVVSCILRSLVYDYTSSIAGQSRGKHRLRPGSRLMTYGEYCLPAIRKRAETILGLFGLQMNGKKTSDGEAWHGFILLPGGDENSSEDRSKGVDYDAPYASLRPGPAWLDSGARLVLECGYFQSFQTDQPMPEELTTMEVLGFNDRGIRLIKFLVNIAHAASWFAFTNWHEAIRTLSVIWLESQISSEEYLESDFSTLRTGTKPDLKERYIVRHIASYCMGQLRGWKTSLDDDIIALCYRGIILARKNSIQQKLDYEGIYLLLFAGIIVVDGEKRERIYGKDTSPESLYIKIKARKYRPRDLFPTLQILSEVQCSGADVIIYQQANVNNKICGVPHKVDRLYCTYVSNSCLHDYYDGFKYTYQGTSKDGSEDLERSRVWDVPPMIEHKQGLCLYDAYRRNGVGCWFQAVDQNPAGQWLAITSAQFSRGPTDAKVVIVIQRHTCYRCTVMQTKEHRYKWSESAGVLFCIIPGRLKGESTT